MMVNAIELKAWNGSLIMIIGRKTPIPLVTRTTNSVPIRRGMS